MTNERHRQIDLQCLWLEVELREMTKAATEYMNRSYGQIARYSRKRFEMAKREFGK